MNVSTHKALGHELGWQVHQSTPIYTSRWFTLRSDEVSFPNGQEGTYTYVEHPGSAIVVPILEDGRVVLIRSYRYTLDAYCWEVPAGRIETKQSPEECALAELSEEIGGHTDTLEHLSTLHIANGFASCPTHFFLATDVVLNHAPRHEDGETITEIEAVSMDQALTRLTKPSSDGQLCRDGDSALALLLASQRLRELNG